MHSASLGLLSGAPKVSTKPEAESGGARTHVLGIIEAFELRGWEVHTFIAGDQISERLRRRGARELAGKHPAKRVGADLIRIGMGITNGRRAYTMLHNQVAWVYERFASFQALGRQFQRSGTPWILETQGLFYYEAHTERNSLQLQSLAKRIESQAYKECDVLVCVSETLRNLILKELEIEPDKVLVVPNAVDTGYFDPSRFRAKKLFDGFTVGYVGGMIRWQALDALIRAIAELASEGIPVNAVLVGDGDMRATWEAQARDLGVAEMVKFMGRVPRDDVGHYIAGFDVAYSGQMSLKIGTMYHSPLKLYECMAMAKPVLATSFEDARRVVQDNATGFLIDPADPSSVTDTLRRAYRAREKLPEMGRKARQEIEQAHTWVSRVDDIIRGTNRILAERGRL